MPKAIVIRNVRIQTIPSIFEYFQIGGRSKNCLNIPRRLTITIEDNAAFGITERYFPRASSVTSTTLDDTNDAT